MKSTFRRLVQLPAQLFSRSTSPRPRTFRKPHRLRLESLEDRSLLTATCTSFSSGDLTIDGDGSDDTITIAASSGNVTLNGSQLLCGGVAVPAANVDALTVNGQGGHDTISLLGVSSAAFSHGSLSGNIAINGGDGNDSLVGSRLAESTSGGNGNDSMSGYEGADTMSGGSGSDTYVYGSATVNHSTDTIVDENNTGDIDTIDFTDLHVRAVVDIGDDSFQIVNLGWVHIDLNAGDVIENVNGSAHNDIIVGNSQDNVLVGNAGNDDLYGLEGDDSFHGGTGNDDLEGGSGSDTYIYGAATINHSTDTITDENNAGDFDTLDFSNFHEEVNVDISDSSFQIVNLGWVHIDLNAGNVIENVIGSAQDDNIVGNAQANVLTGNAGDDDLDGGVGDDVLDGGAGEDDLVGGNDNDTFHGGTDNDTMTGGAGSDTYVYGAATINHSTDTIVEQNNTGDVDALDFTNFHVRAVVDISDSSFQIVSLGWVHIDLNAGDVIENVYGSAYNDIIVGNSQGNVIEGNGGNDNIAGGDGADELSGGIGADTLNGGNHDDTLYGGSGVDSLTGGGGTDTHIEGISEDVFGDSIEVYIP
jgi:Ca2+-binding RTX toxin-like protein